jgi:hypothetical protein
MYGCPIINFRKIIIFFLTKIILKHHEVHLGENVGTPLIK